MTRVEQSPQFASNGHGKDHGLSSKDIRRFVNTVTNSPVPDIDRANEILGRVPAYYEGLGVPPKDRKRIARDLEARLHGGTAEDQVRVSQTLLSIEQTHNALKGTFPNRRRLR